MSVPTWLEEFGPESAFRSQDFFGSRVVYYPGSGVDGHPVKVFGSTHSAHCFVYADYGLSQAQLETALEDSRKRFRGYHSIARVRLRESELVPEGWTSHLRGDAVDPQRVQLARVAARVATAPFGFLEILERDRELDDSHGAHRIAVLFLGADGVAAFDALFCQRPGMAPFAVVLQDHGFGGNHDSFGGGGSLEQVAMDCGALPPWLLVAHGTVPWHGFDRRPGVDGDLGGMHENLRFLYGRREA